MKSAPDACPGAQSAHRAAVVARCGALREAAKTLRGEARTSRLRAIQLRYATGRAYRGIFGPVFVMADVAGDRGDFTPSAVAAHRLLGSSAVVSMGISTLLSLWDRLLPDERESLLRRMADHASSIDDGLKHMVNGFDPDELDRMLAS